MFHKHENLTKHVCYTKLTQYRCCYNKTTFAVESCMRGYHVYNDKWVSMCCRRSAPEIERIFMQLRYKKHSRDCWVKCVFDRIVLALSPHSYNPCCSSQMSLLQPLCTAMYMLIIGGGSCFKWGGGGKLQSSPSHNTRKTPFQLLALIFCS